MGSDSKAEWWQRNEELKAQLGLPSYSPPQFSDGTYTHEVVDELEERYECNIQFIGVNTQYPDDLEVRVDSEIVFEIGRHRNDDGNTIYECTASAFRSAVKEAVDE